jgi:hypothetical protein
MRGFHAWPCLVLLALVPGCGGCGGDDAATPDGGPDASDDEDAPATVASPPPGVYRELPTVTLTADEPATIYYTTDGSAPTTASESGPSPVTVSGVVDGTPVRFFASDSAGNEETAQEVTYLEDRLGPEPVQGFTAAPDGNDVDLTWVNPTGEGFAQVVVARVTDVSTTVAADGTDYAVDDTLGASTIVYVGTGTSFTDAGRGPGHHTYLAWAQYDTRVYAEGRTAGARVATPTQTCEISIDVTGGTATVTTQAANWTLAVSNYTDTAGAITMDVGMTSGLAGVTFNPKLAFTSVLGTGGTPDITNETGVIDVDAASVPYVFYGPRGVLSGGSASRSLAITANGATAITLGCRVLDDPGLFYAEWCAVVDDGGGVWDSRTAEIGGGMVAPSRFSASATNTCTQWQSLVLSPDQRYVYAGPRSGKVIAKIDTTTFAAVAGLDVTVAGVSASAGRLSLDPSGRRLYAGVNDGSHGGGYSAGPSATATVVNLVVEVATADMSEESRTTVGTGTEEHRLLRAKLSPDGRTIAVTIGSNYVTTPNNELRFFDASRWTEIDADPDTQGVQPIPLGTLRAVNVEFDGTGRYVVVGSGGDDTQATFGLVDRSDMTIDILTSPEGRLSGASWDVDAFLLFPEFMTQVHRLAPATGVITSVGTSGDANVTRPMVGRRVGGSYVIQAGGQVAIIDVVTGLLTDSFSGPSDSHVMSMTQ